MKFRFRLQPFFVATRYGLILSPVSNMWPSLRFIPKLSSIHDESKEDSDIHSGSLVGSNSLIWIYVEMSLSSKIRSAVSLLMS